MIIVPTLASADIEPYLVLPVLSVELLHQGTHSVRVEGGPPDHGNVLQVPFFFAPECDGYEMIILVM